jgi:hypothetical protein
MIERLQKTDSIDYPYIDEEGTSWRSRADYLYIKVLPSCGCGDPASIGRYVKDMLLRHVKQTGSDDTSCWKHTNYDDLPVMFFLSWADREGYIEHGTTIRCSWMTPKGDELLRDLAAVEAEEEP